MHRCHNNVGNIFHVAAKLLEENLFQHLSETQRQPPWGTYTHN